MTAPADSPSPAPLAGRSPLIQWLILLTLSALFAGLLEWANMPAALLVGPMLAAVVAGTNGATVRTPKLPLNVAQAVVGVLVAASIETEVLLSVIDGWPLFLAVVLATVAASSLLGWAISQWKVLPGTTGVWGSAPGASTAMVLMAEAFGADVRLVAFMQYLRVIMVSLSAALIARMFIDTSGVEPPPIAWFPVIEWTAFLSTIGVVLAGMFVGKVLRLPAGNFLGTVTLAVALHVSGIADFQLPEWLLAASYMLIGWNVGLNFTRPILLHAFRALPQVLGSIVALMLFCAGLGWLISYQFGIDPLSAYLATSPGGMDTVAIVAAASENVNLSFIMALQAMRLLFLLLFGPAIARAVAKWVKD